MLSQESQWLHLPILIRTLASSYAKRERKHAISQRGIGAKHSAQHFVAYSLRLPTNEIREVNLGITICLCTAIYDFKTVCLMATL